MGSEDPCFGPAATWALTSFFLTIFLLGTKYAQVHLLVSEEEGKTFFDLTRTTG